MHTKNLDATPFEEEILRNTKKMREHLIESVENLKKALEHGESNYILLRENGNESDCIKLGHIAERLTAMIHELEGGEQKIKGKLTTLRGIIPRVSIKWPIADNKMEKEVSRLHHAIRFDRNDLFDNEEKEFSDE